MDKNENIVLVRVFKNPVLEALTKTFATVTLLVYIPLILFFL